MSRKDSWSNAPTDVYYSSSDIDFMKNASSLAFDNHRSNDGFMSSNTDSYNDDIYVNDAIYGKSNALDSNSCTYPLADITQTGSSLHLSGISENKDASDFLCCSWPEIGNFEDVDWMFRNCDSTFGGFYHVSSPSNESTDLPSGHTFHQAFQSVNMQPQQLAPGHSSNQISSVLSDDTSLSDLACLNPMPYTEKSEPNDVTLLSRSQSSYAQSMENSQDSPVQGASVPGYEEREKLDDHQGVRCYVNKSLKDGMMVQGSMCDSFSIDELECHSDGGGLCLVVPSESGPADIQKSSTTGSSLDDISLEAASFHQLQLVKEQLDSGTKLCIRNSLYRLARSAELRHNCANQDGSYEDESRGLVAERRNKFAAFKDIETKTNPMDRSIAHLLFHKPQDSPVSAALASQLV